MFEEKLMAIKFWKKKKNKKKPEEKPCGVSCYQSRKDSHLRSLELCRIYFVSNFPVMLLRLKSDVGGNT